MSSQRLNDCLQATPDCVMLLFLGLRSGVPEAKRSALTTS